MDQPTTPATYYWYFVIPNLEDLRGDPGDVRKAFNSAISTFHLSDVFFKYYRRHDCSRLPRKNRKNFLIYLGNAERAFLTIQAAATVYKHMYISNSFLDADSPQSFGGVVTKQKVRIEGGWKPALKKENVTLEKKDGTIVSLNDDLEKVVCNLWPKILGKDLEVDC